MRSSAVALFETDSNHLHQNVTLLQYPIDSKSLSRVVSVDVVIMGGKPMPPSTVAYRGGPSIGKSTLLLEVASSSDAALNHAFKVETSPPGDT